MIPCRYPYFYQDNILKTSVPKVMTAKQVAESGLGLDDITEILNAHAGVTAEALHTNPKDTSLDQFRQSIANAMSQPDTYLIANFDRFEFMGEGGGHHSPLGAFCAASDTVLVLDVARYRSVSLSTNLAYARIQIISRPLQAEHRIVQGIAGGCMGMHQCQKTCGHKRCIFQDMYSILYMHVMDCRSGYDSHHRAHAFLAGKTLQCLCF